MDLVKQLKIYRLENRVTQVQLAENIGVSFSIINPWLNGKTKSNKIQQHHIVKFPKKHLQRKNK
ncbi:helix-turn-helix transcriptional regulator [bacterium]|nr:helix-turn-helix transcriptional regulator [bacterium]